MHAARPCRTIDGLRDHEIGHPAPHFMRTTYFRGNPSKITIHLFPSSSIPYGFFFPQKHAILKIYKNTTSFRKCWVRASSNLMHLLLAVFFGQKSNKDLWQMPRAQNDQKFPQKSLSKSWQSRKQHAQSRCDVKNGSSRWFRAIWKNASLGWSFLQVRVKINIFETTT